MSTALVHDALSGIQGGEPKAIDGKSQSEFVLGNGTLVHEQSVFGNCRFWLWPFRRIRFELRHFLWCYLIIVMLAILDTYLVFRFQEVIEFTEQNPVCLFLIQCDLESLSFFVAGKLLGTASALATIYLVFRWRSHVGVFVVQAMALFQIGLIGYQLLS